MIELVLMLIILPRLIKPLARARSRSWIRWTLAAMAAWLGGELAVILIYTFVYTIGSTFFGWPKDVERQPATYLCYFVALVIGLVCADVVRRVLTRIPVGALPSVPPPPVFNR